MSDKEDDDENVDREEEQQQDAFDPDEGFGGAEGAADNNAGRGNDDAEDDQGEDGGRKANVADVFGDSDGDEDEDDEAQKRDEEMIRRLNNKKRARQPEPEDNDEGDVEDEAAGDADEDDDDEFTSKKAAKSKKGKAGKQPQKKRPRKRIDVSNFFLEEAEQGEDEDEEEEENRQAAEEILEEDHQAAVDAVERRHQAARERLNMSAEELADEFERRHKEQARRQKMQGQIYGGEGGVRLGGSAVMQQSLLPSINDPGIWKVKCTTGNEQMLVRSIFLKAADAKHRGQPIYIKSAFCNASKGYVYIEALAEPYAREAITGLRGLWQSSFQRIAVQEMTTLLTVTVTKKPLKMGQWVRLKRSVLKGDLARVVDILEGGSKVLIQAVPRPDYEKRGEKEKSSSGSKAKPAQRMFDVEEARKLKLEVSRRTHPADRHGRNYDFFGNDYYRDGYVYKEVSVATFIDAENVKPRLDELRLFQSQVKKARSADDPDYDDDDEDEEEAAAESQSLLKDIAAQLRDLGDEGTGGVTPYVQGDMVQVTSGELRNLVGRVLTVNEVNRTVTIAPMNSVLTAAIVVESDLLVKYVVVGAHVKVVTGQHSGQTGRVVSVNNVDGEHIAAILTDGMNTEIQSNVSSLQVSSEIATGHGHLDGYELYDLVALNENEYGVVVLVGNERLVVVTHVDMTKDVLPQQLQGKKNHQSNRASGFDSQQTSIFPGDTIKVVSGVHAHQSGTIRHIMKGNLWLHSNTYLKNSGIFAVRARLCVVAGKRAGVALGAGPTSFSSTASAASVGSKVAAVTGPNYKAARDSNVGKTVRITKGQYKGELAQVVDATGTHYSVELLSKMRKVMVEKEKTLLVGDKGGILDPKKRALRHSASDHLHNVLGPDGVPNTPYLQGSATPGMGGETPRMLGSETPLQGSETPLGGRTPGYAESDSWAIKDSDTQPLDDRGGSSTSQLSASVGGWGTSASYSSTVPSPGVGSPTLGSNYQLWDRDFVVTIKSGRYTGKLAVVMRRPTASGIVTIAFYDTSRDRIDESEAFDIAAVDLRLSEPAKRCKVQLISGKNAGSTGVVRTVIGNDVVLEPTGGARTGEMHKLAAVAWLYR